MSKKFSAHYVFPVFSPPVKNGIIVVNDSGIITEIITPEGEPTELARLEFHSGILIPGFEKLTIAHLLDRQMTKSESSLNDLLASFATPQNQGFELGKPCSILLLSGVDLTNFRITEKSRLKKLV